MKFGIFVNSRNNFSAFFFLFRIIVILKTPEFVNITYQFSEFIRFKKENIIFCQTLKIHKYIYYQRF